MPGHRHSPCRPWQCEQIPHGYFGYFSGQRVKIKFGNVEGRRDQTTSWHPEFSWHRLLLLTPFPSFTEPLCAWIELGLLTPNPLTHSSPTHTTHLLPTHPSQTYLLIPPYQPVHPSLMTAHPSISHTPSCSPLLGFARQHKCSPCLYTGRRQSLLSGSPWLQGMAL